MIGVLTTAGSAVANSRALQIGIIGGLFVITFLFWLRARDEQIRKMERMIAERQARLAQDKIRKTNNEKLAKAERTRSNFRTDDVDHAFELSDDAIARLTRRTG